VNKEYKEQIEEMIEEKIEEHEECSATHSFGLGVFLFLWLLAITAIILAVDVAPHIKVV